GAAAPAATAATAGTGSGGANGTTGANGRVPHGPPDGHPAPGITTLNPATVPAFHPTDIPPDRTVDRIIALDQFPEAGQGSRYVDDVAALLRDTGIAPIRSHAIVRIARCPGVTTWPIGDRVHIIDGAGAVYVLGDRATAVWRRLTFGHVVSDVIDR